MGGAVVLELLLSFAMLLLVARLWGQAGVAQAMQVVVRGGERELHAHLHPQDARHVLAAERADLGLGRWPGAETALRFSAIPPRTRSGLPGPWSGSMGRCCGRDRRRPSPAPGDARGPRAARCPAHPPLKSLHIAQFTLADVYRRPRCRRRHPTPLSEAPQSRRGARRGVGIRMTWRFCAAPELCALV